MAQTVERVKKGAKKREEREAEALRENLRKRKEQQRVWEQGSAIKNKG